MNTRALFWGEAGWTGSAHTLGTALFGLSALMSLMVVAHEAGAEPTRAASPAPVPGCKTPAPVRLELGASDTRGVVWVELQVVAVEDTGAALARLVLPKGARLLGGGAQGLEVSLGRLRQGEARWVRWEVELPEGAQGLAAGVDVEVHEGLRLHQSAALVWGQLQDRTRLVKLPEGTRARIEVLP